MSLFATPVKTFALDSGRGQPTIMLDSSLTVLAQDARAPAPVASILENWSESLAERARTALQRRIYGRIPDLSALEVEAVHVVQSGPFKIERWRLGLRTQGVGWTFDALVVTPQAAPLRVLLLAQIHRYRGAAIDAWVAHLCGLPYTRGVGSRARELVLGRHIHIPPFETILGAGVGLVLFRPADVVPDHALKSAPVVENLSGNVAVDERGGVLAHWAGLTSALRARVAERFRKNPLVAWGHSRHGKATLLAGAFDQGFAGVIAHQSGRYGAALTDGAQGESAAQISRAYPHWFCQRFVREGAGAHAGLDQHHLLALLAPRPVLLGNAAGDFWADPAGSVRAARAASTAYRATGVHGLADEAHPNYSGEIVIFERPGWHGVNAHDWRQFLAFLDAKFMQPRDAVLERTHA